MKIKNIFVVILFLLFGNSYAQKIGNPKKSGKIIFSISYPESQLDENVLSKMPSEAVMFFKNDFAKVEVGTPMGNTTIISDSKTGEGTMLMNMMNKKWAIKINKDKMMKEKLTEGKPKIEQTNESKIIAGLNCKKSIVTVKTKKGEKSFEVWFTNELKIKNSFSSQIEGIDGFLMEFFNNQGGMSMKMSAQSVEFMDVSDSEFIVPEGYELKTIDELKNTSKGK